MEDYIDAIVNEKLYAVTASFVLSILIERGLVISLQNRMLYKSICRLPDKNDLKKSLNDNEEYIEALSYDTYEFQFNARESYIMKKCITFSCENGH